MDLLTMIDKELSSMHLNDFERIRYIYLRTCELFSFDARYNFTELFKDETLYQYLVNRKIDITDLNDFLVVCHSYSRYVLLRLIRELTTAQVEIISGAHSFVEYKNKEGQSWNLDATNGDLFRVKLSLETRGFTSQIEYNQELLAETDSILGYSSKNKLEYLRQINVSSKKEIFDSISKILQNSKCKAQFSDAYFLIEYLLLGINFYEFKDSSYVARNYSFYQIFNPIGSNDYWCLNKINECYELNPIEKDECLKLTRNLYTKLDILR